MTHNRLSVFQGKRVLVTGDTGFKGSWLALWLHDLGAEVTGAALPAEEQSHFALLSLERLIRHVDCDIRDLDRVRHVFDDARPEIVFHLAAQPLVRHSYADPKTTFDTNVGGSVNILEAVRHTPSVRALVYITSDKCYRNKRLTRGYHEGDELGGHDPYSASKACAEIVCAAYTASFFSSAHAPGIASTRAGNVIGGGDWSQNRLIPDCIRALTDGEPIVLRNPDATRPWQHVLEPLRGYLILAANLFEDPRSCGGAWNFGPAEDAAWTVEAMTHKIVAVWGSGSVRVERPRDLPHEDQLLSLNAEKARLELGWQPWWSVERTVEETVSWHKAVAGGCLAREVTRAQIAAYSASSGDYSDQWSAYHTAAADC